MPGGGIEHGETIDQALKREVQEEIGATVTSIDHNSLKAWTIIDKSANRPCIFLAYRVTIDTPPKPGLYNDIIIAYVSAQELKNFDTEDHHKPYRHIFEQLYNS